MRISDWSSDVCSSDLITLTPNAEVGDRELVSLGIPFAPGELTDAALVRIVDGNGVEVPAFVKPTLRWHWLDDSIRAVKVQFFADPRQGYGFRTDQPRTESNGEEPYDRGTRPGKMDAPVPRVIATLDPKWLVHSRSEESREGKSVSVRVDFGGR